MFPYKQILLDNGSILSAGPSLGFYKGSATINEMLGEKHSEAAANDLTNNFSLFRNGGLNSLKGSSETL